MLLRHLQSAFPSVIKNPQITNLLPKFWKTEIDEITKDERIVFTDRVSVNQIKDLIHTRQDLKREINALKRFSRRGAEDIITIDDDLKNTIQMTKWQKSEINRRIGMINRKRNKRLNELREIEQKRGDESLGYTKGEFGMGRQEQRELEPMKPFFYSMEQKDVRWKMRSIFKESQQGYFTEKDFLLKQNYIKSLQQNFNSNDIKGVIKSIENMDMNSFMQRFYEQGGNFEWSYPPNQEEYEKYLSHLSSIWA